jgi:hypothetical protein
MTGLQVLLGVAGLVVTMLVVAGMILITPGGEVELDGVVRGQQGADLSRADQQDPAPARAAP